MQFHWLLLVDIQWNPTLWPTRFKVNSPLFLFRRNAHTFLYKKTPLIHRPLIRPMATFWDPPCLILYNLTSFIYTSLKFRQYQPRRQKVYFFPCYQIKTEISVISSPRTSPWVLHEVFSAPVTPSGLLVDHPFSERFISQSIPDSPGTYFFATGIDGEAGIAIWSACTVTNRQTQSMGYFSRQTVSNNWRTNKGENNLYRCCCLVSSWTTVKFKFNLSTVESILHKRSFLDLC